MQMPDWMLRNGRCTTPCTQAVRPGRNATVGTERGLNATLNVPDLAPFAATNGPDLTGATSLTLHAAIQGDVTTITADGKVAITGGMQQARALVGDNGQLDLAAALRGSDLTLPKLQFNGHSIAITADGRVASNLADLGWTFRSTISPRRIRI